MMSEACPKCGAVVREDHDSYRRFACMALEFDEVQHLGMHYELRESVDCLRHQLETARAALAQRDERNAALEARNKELEEENAELLSKLEQIIAPVEVGGGIEAVLRTMVKELEAELARPKHEVLRQLADAIERIKELEGERDSCRQRIELAEQYHDQAEAEIVELRRAINGIAPTDPTRFEDLDLCVALNNHADLAAVATVVRAAAMQAEVRDAWTALIDSAASATYYDACETTEGAARALPADLLERMGVTHEG